MTVLKCLEEVGATLNRGKCEIFRPTVKFLGHILDKQGIRADPEKTSAIAKMEAPKSVSDVRRFMGLVNQLGKISPKIAEYSQAINYCIKTELGCGVPCRKNPSHASKKSLPNQPYWLTTTLKPRQKYLLKHHLLG